MNRKILIYSLTFLSLSLIISCKDDDPEPLQAEVQGKLLAGEKGSSKSWKLTKLVYEDSDGTEDYDFEVCFLDNIYKFSNNDSQDYSAVEGTTKCNANDATTIESGTWAFTIEGKIVIILPDLTNNGYGTFFSFLTAPADVIELTETSFKIKIDFNDSGDIYSYIVTFVKI
jgi:hypothetical protein